jgi:hypothetical protein
MTDGEWLTALRGASTAKSGRSRAQVLCWDTHTQLLPFKHRLTNQCKIVHFPLQSLRRPETMKTEILRQSTV